MTFFEFISTWLLGFLTNALVNDNKAISECRDDLIEIEKEMESLRKEQSNTHRSADRDANGLKRIKEILKRLNGHHAGLLIKNPELQQLIERSLARIKEWEINHSEPQNITSHVAVELASYWGTTDRVYEAKKIQELQASFFHRGLLVRCWFFIRNNKIITVGVILLLLFLLFLKYYFALL